MIYKGYELKGTCNDSHAYIRYDDATRLFVLTAEGADRLIIVAEGLNPRTLTDFAFLDGALTVVHDYDLRLYQP